MKKGQIEQLMEALRTGHRHAPDSAWVAKTREILMMQVSNSMPTQTVSWSQRFLHGQKLFSYPGRLLSAMRGPVLAALSIFGMVAGGSIASVSAAENAVPGDFLYSLKLATEQTRLAFTTNKTSKLKLKTHYLAERANEIKAVAASENPKKQERIQAAVEIVKRDLDTVKTQLAEVTKEGQTGQTVEVAKLVDKQSTLLVDTLKNVRVNMPEMSRAKVAEAEVAAVNTGVKAVQVLLGVQTNPNTKEAVNNQELVQSIHDKVQGLEAHVEDAAQKLDAASTSTSFTVSAASVSSSAVQIADVKQSLVETKQLIVENKLDQVAVRLLETANAVATVEKTIETIGGGSTSGTMMMPLDGTSTSTGGPSASTSPTSSTTSGVSAETEKTVP